MLSNSENNRWLELPGVDFLVGISKYLSDGHELRVFFSFRGCFSSLASVILDSKKWFTNILWISAEHIFRINFDPINDWFWLRLFDYLWMMHAFDHFCRFLHQPFELEIQYPVVSPIALLPFPSKNVSNIQFNLSISKLIYFKLKPRSLQQIVLYYSVHISQNQIFVSFYKGFQLITML